PQPGPATPPASAGRGTGGTASGRAHRRPGARRAAPTEPRPPRRRRRPRPATPPTRPAARPAPGAAAAGRRVSSCRPSTRWSASSDCRGPGSRATATPPPSAPARAGPRMTAGETREAVKPELRTWRISQGGYDDTAATPATLPEARALLPERLR